MAQLHTFGETMALLTSPVTGPLRHATGLEVGMAGCESNVAIGARRLGLDVAWAGRVGDDEFGRMVLSRLRGEDVDITASSVDPAAPTGLMIKSTRLAGTTQVIYYRRHSAASRLCPDHLDEDGIKGASVLHISGITAALSSGARETVFSAIELAAGAKTMVSFDPNYRAALWSPEEAGRCFRELAARANVVLAGADEAAMMLGSDGPGAGGGPEALAQRLHAAGAAHAIVKLGAHGAVAVVDGTVHRRASLPVTVVDPVGAGDGFAAGYLTGLIEQREPEACLDLATRVGAFAVTVRGDWEGLPHRDELDLLDAADGTTLR